MRCGRGFKFGGQSLRRTYLMAALTNIANPKVIFFYLAFFPRFVTEGGWATPVQFLIMGAVFLAVGPVVRRWLNRVSAAIFGGLAVRLVVDR